MPSEIDWLERVLRNLALPNDLSLHGERQLESLLRREFRAYWKLRHD